MINFLQWERRWQELAILLLLIGLTTPVFWLSDLDYQAAALFYQPDNPAQPWPWQQAWLWQNLFRYATKFTLTLVMGALLIILGSYVVSKWQVLRRPALYVLLVIALGPGLIVNIVFKDHWGRPRPVHISQFGGEMTYIPPLQLGHTRDKSFPCGHCSVAYLFFSFYFLSRKHKRLYLFLTLSLALLMALTRMLAGGHFLSDILWSGYLVFFVAWSLYYGWYVHTSKASSK